MTLITITHRAVCQSGHDRCRNTEVALEDATVGSDRLSNALRAEFKRAALEHGITVHDASLLLMNGVAI
jgi:hypothetical protein